ncbi:MAG: class I SAM-dependent methyltransferase [Candidatus Hodarchaeota archaeon]
MSSFHLPGLLYDWVVERFLKRSKARIAQSIQRSLLYPALDIGCGSGKQCSLITREDDLVIGLDIDNRMLQYGHSKYKKVCFICADAAITPFRDSSFRGIILSYALHEHKSSFRDQLIQEADRLLASNGRLIILDFDSAWKERSIIAYILIYLIERIAGKEHFLNGREFLRQGGLSAFVRRTNLKLVKKARRARGNSSLIVLEKAQEGTICINQV